MFAARIKMANEWGCQGTREYRRRPSYDILVASVVRVPSVWSSIYVGLGLFSDILESVVVGKNCNCFSPHIQ